MNVQGKRIILLLVLLYLQCLALFSQSYSSRNNYTGAWETPSTWDPLWAVPQTNMFGINATIFGCITVNGSLSINGTATRLVVNDTLIIKGNLILDNNNDISINDNGILIVMGNFTINNQTNVIANGYLAVAGSLTKNSSQGTFTSNDNPVKVFIGGVISPANLTSNNPYYTALNCSAPITAPYLNSTCSYGNFIDFGSDPINSFFQNICTKTNVKTNSSVCVASTLNLTSSAGTAYSWSGPNGFTSSVQNPSISNASPAMTGAYIITVTAGVGCMDKDTINVTVNPLPIATAASNSPVCEGSTINLASTGGTTYSWKGPKSFTSNEQNPQIFNSSTNMSGNYTVTVTTATGCTANATQSIIVNVMPVANAGVKQELKYGFETKMNAELSSSETGEWSLISGSGILSDKNSPITTVTDLSEGENVFLWKVRNGNCEASDEVIIIVYDRFIPSIITPNGDGKNDYFEIGEINDPVELIILNRWGNVEYSNSNYLNDWDGRNNKGAELPDDTYFYVLRFGNIKIIKGSVLVKR